MLMNNVQLLIGMIPEQVEEIDPVRYLYPFMVAASGDTNNLNSIYYLLRLKLQLSLACCVGDAKA